MNEPLLESAHLYVLGLLTKDDRVALEHALHQQPELQREVHALQEAALLLARSAPQVAPPPDMKAFLLAQFQESAGDSLGEVVLPYVAGPSAGGPSVSSPSARAVTRPAGAAVKGPVPSPPTSRLHLLLFIPWAAAAALAVLFYQSQQMITSAQNEVTAVRVESASLKEREKHLLNAVSSSAAAQAESAAALAEARGSLVKAEAALVALHASHDTISTELAQLKEDSQFDKTRIAVLGSLLKNQPSAVAVSLWRQERQEGLLVVENLPALPAGRDYQLWVIDPNLKTPVSAGIFKVDAAGKVRIEFKPDRTVQSAYKFAVTMEKEGGAKVPTLDQMVVIGG